MLFTFGDPLERKFVLKSRPVVVVVGDLQAILTGGTLGTMTYYKIPG